MTPTALFLHKRLEVLTNFYSWHLLLFQSHLLCRVQKVLGAVSCASWKPKRAAWYCRLASSDGCWIARRISWSGGLTCAGKICYENDNSFEKRTLAHEFWPQQDTFCSASIDFFLFSSVVYRRSTVMRAKSTEHEGILTTAAKPILGSPWEEKWKKDRSINRRLKLRQVTMTF